VKAAVAQRLIDLNKEFYQKLASPFSATRSRVQPGVRRILSKLTGDETILDLGCGNGSVAGDLTRREHRGRYVGLDFSEELLAAALIKAPGANFTFAQADLTAEGLAEHPAIHGQQFDLVVSFACLHHIPSQELRLRLLIAARTLVRPEARFVLSNWQFLNSTKLTARIQPWETAGLSEKEVDPSDYLLDWRGGGLGLRYVHHFDLAELEGLAKGAGFVIEETYSADGDTGNLALYQVWKRVES
jgi:tRNA (uracil-5-)-methyltransferase TRM9